MSDNEADTAAAEPDIADVIEAAVSGPHVRQLVFEKMCFCVV